MVWWQILLIAVAAVVVLLVAVLVIRTLAFRPIAESYPKAEPVEFDKQKAVDDLADMIRIKTVSSRNAEEEDDAEFEKFVTLLQSRFPVVNASATVERIGNRTILFKINGQSSAAPSVFMAHYDVVSVNEADWSKPPFAGEIENGVLWGRGTLDTKGTLNGVMQACETLLKGGFKPQNDLYLAFSGNEEIAGTGAPMIVDELIKRGVKPELVVDEGGAVVENVFPGVKQPCALVGIGEKGMADIEFTVKGNGGHASSPPPHTAVGELSAACVRMEAHPFPFSMGKPAAEMFDTLGRHSSFALRMVFANLWLFKGVLNKLCKKKGGEMNALIRTTCAFTQMQGSKGSNVLPPEAKMCANYRIISGETVESVVERTRKTIKNDNIEIKVLYGSDPSVVSDTKCDGYDKLKCAIAQTWTGALISPYLMVACSDSRHYGKLTDKVYRFSAMALTSEERKLIHGNDERVPLETIYKTVEFYLRLISQC